MEAGTILSERFELIRPIASGGSASVWSAHDRRHGERAAIKFVHPHARRRRDLMQREVQALSKLRHPNIAGLLDVRLEGDAPFLALQFSPGSTLGTRLEIAALRGQSLDPAWIRDVFEGICSALTHAHSQGVLHRDLKPSNVMVCEEGPTPRVTVLDFGLSTLLTLSDDERTTRGRTAGTFAYMAPEQVMGRATTVRTDIFALGVLLFEMSTLRRGFMTEDDGVTPCAFREALPVAGVNDPGRIARRICVSDRRSWVPWLDPALAELTLRAAHPRPEQRHPTAGRFFSDLDRAMPFAGDPTSVGTAQPVEATAEPSSGIWLDVSETTGVGPTTSRARPRVAHPPATRSDSNGFDGPTVRGTELTAVPPAPNAVDPADPGHPGHPIDRADPGHPVDRASPAEPAAARPDGPTAPVGQTPRSQRVHLEWETDEASAAARDPQRTASTPRPSFAAGLPGPWSMLAWAILFAAGCAVGWWSTRW
ncbi:MAG TPA: protein kinase [Myxococcales bacterium LLY-WYZ-16_1]|nr:protein kinase [Myxococcales bacterium LLY-WYZ-16_1]